MFKVIDKTTGEIYTVYGLNGTSFLLYNVDLDWWFYKDIDECRPYNPPKEENWLVRGRINAADKVD